MGQFYFLVLSQSRKSGWAWWYMSVILALGRLREEDCKFQASL
jgi:hypothetical protein